MPRSFPCTFSYAWVRVPRRWPTVDARAHPAAHCARRGRARPPWATPAILKKFKDELEDLEHSEILSFLRRLPVMDMDQVTLDAARWMPSRASADTDDALGRGPGPRVQILTEAYNLKDDATQSNL